MREDRLERLEAAVLEYIERYGLTDKARRCFSAELGQEDKNARAQSRKPTEPDRSPR